MTQSNIDDKRQENQFQATFNVSVDDDNVFFFNDDYFKLINLNKHLEQQLYLIYNVRSHFIKARF